ncbi:MAG: DUF4157 domain-containing protein [Pseudomonadota bacterium]
MGNLAKNSDKGRPGISIRSAAGKASTKQSSIVRSILHSGRSERLQAKLRISTPGDAFEREADRVAEQVMRMQVPQPSSAIGKSSQTNSALPHGGTIQRICATCAEEEALIQTKTTGVSTPEVTPAISNGIRALKGGGRSISKSEQHFFGPRIGADFSNVRVHDDMRAATLARSINARAFTIGHNVVFGAGEYSSGTSSGRKLLAHELTHVVQQNEWERSFADLSVVAPASNTVMREDDDNSQQYSGCTQDQIDAIEAARRAAAVRCQRAAFQTKGIVPPGPPGRRDPAEDARRRARRIARRIFGEDLNMEQVGNIVSEMGGRLASGSLPFTCAPATDSNCGNRAAYVIGNRAPVFLCPAFFNNSSDEERIRTLVHEAAHLSGIGEAIGESYCAIYDCDTSCGGFDVADSWSHYVHCVTGQTPDQPDEVRPDNP